MIMLIWDFEPCGIIFTVCLKLLLFPPFLKDIVLVSIRSVGLRDLHVRKVGFMRDFKFSRRRVSSLMMEAVRTSETSVDNHFTRQYNPEDNSEHQAL
jgi:hypothetical protein